MNRDAVRGDETSGLDEIWDPGARVCQRFVASRLAELSKPGVTHSQTASDEAISRRVRRWGFTVRDDNRQCVRSALGTKRRDVIDGRQNRLRTSERNLMTCPGQQIQMRMWQCPV